MCVQKTYVKMSKSNVRQIPLAEEDFEDHLLSISEISSIASDDSLSPPPPTIPMRKISLIERRGLHIEGLKLGEKGYYLNIKYVKTYLIAKCAFLN